MWLCFRSHFPHLNTLLVMLVNVYLYIIPEHELSRDMFEEGKRFIFPILFPEHVRINMQRFKSIHIVVLQYPKVGFIFCIKL